MLGACGDCNHSTARSKTAHLHRRISGVVCAIAELTTEIGAPRENRTIGFQGKAMLAACRNRNYSGARAETADLSRYRSGGEGTISELAVIVVAPGENRTIRLQNEAVKICWGDANGSIQSCQREGTQLAVRAAVAELARIVLAPCQNRAIALQGHSVSAGAGKRDHSAASSQTADQTV